MPFLSIQCCICNADKNQLIGKYILFKQKSTVNFPNSVMTCHTPHKTEGKHSPDGTFVYWIHSGPNRTLVSCGELFGIWHFSDNSAKKRWERLVNSTLANLIYPSIIWFPIAVVLLQCKALKLGRKHCVGIQRESGSLLLSQRIFALAIKPARKLPHPPILVAFNW